MNQSTICLPSLIEENILLLEDMLIPAGEFTLADNFDFVHLKTIILGPQLKSGISIRHHLGQLTHFHLMNMIFHFCFLLILVFAFECKFSWLIPRFQINAFADASLHFEIVFGRLFQKSFSVKIILVEIFGGTDRTVQWKQATILCRPQINKKFNYS